MDSFLVVLVDSKIIGAALPCEVHSWMIRGVFFNEVHLRMTGGAFSNEVQF